MKTTTTHATTRKQLPIRILDEAELDAVNGGSIFEVVKGTFYGAIGYGNVSGVIKAYAAGYLAGSH